MTIQQMLPGIAVIALLAGPTALWWIVRALVHRERPRALPDYLLFAEGESRPSQFEELLAAGRFWRCDGCSSLNAVSLYRCYHCGASRTMLAARAPAPSASAVAAAAIPITRGIPVMAATGDVRVGTSGGNGHEPAEVGILNNGMDGGGLYPARTWCPLLGVRGHPQIRFELPHPDHRCHAVSPPAPIERGHQEMFCLGESHGRCPLYRALDELISSGGSEGGPASEPEVLPAQAAVGGPHRDRRRAGSAVEP